MNQQPPQQLDPVQIRPRTKQEILEHIQAMNRELMEEKKRVPTHKESQKC